MTDAISPFCYSLLNLCPLSLSDGYSLLNFFCQNIFFSGKITQPNQSNLFFWVDLLRVHIIMNIILCRNKYEDQVLDICIYLCI